MVRVRTQVLLRRGDKRDTGRLPQPRRTSDMAKRTLVAIGVLRGLLIGMAICAMGIAVAGVGIRMPVVMRLRRLHGSRRIAEILLANDHSCCSARVKRQPQHHDNQQNFSSHSCSVAIKARERKARRV